MRSASTGNEDTGQVYRLRSVFVQQWAAVSVSDAPAQRGPGHRASPKQPLPA